LIRNPLAAFNPKSPATLVLAVSLFIAITGNAAFFRKILEIYPLSRASLLSTFSLFVVLTAATFLVLNLLGPGKLLKPVLVLSLILASMIAYAGGTFGMVADETMIANLFKSDGREVHDLLTFKFFLYVTFLGIGPAIAVIAFPITARSRRREAFSRLKAIGLAFFLAVVAILPFGRFYASYLREHKDTRSYANPVYFYYSAGKYVSRFKDEVDEKMAELGQGAKIALHDQTRDLVVLVVGETARADHFSLNGYAKDTTPNLRRENAISLSDLWSCGTSTAVSVPCMFSPFGRANFSDRKFRRSQNLLDILQKTGEVSVLWRDNNSDSKGVADRVPFEDFRAPDKNPICDEECRDEGMLAGLQEYIDVNRTKDLFIVLHQMGNHGPAYYNRYPVSRERFRPACRTKQLEDCTPEEINNAYDNAIAYTDEFLGKVIALLKQNEGPFDTAMVYMSDHGESLGERGVYLHGLPYLIAPEAQKRPAGAIWLGDRMGKKIDLAKLAARAKTPLSHDNLFHSMLGLFEIETKEYDPSLDLFH
jgi:lipid A ethanolaminephosphotransferase